MSAVDLFMLLVLVLLLTLALALSAVGGNMALGQKAGNKTQKPDTALGLLNRQWRIERSIYRHHRLAGLLIVAAAGFFFFKTWQVGLLESNQLGDAWRITLWLLAAGNLLNLFIGLTLLLRPSRLKPIENLSNRWFDVTGESVQHRPRLLGTLIVLVSLVCAAGFGVFLLLLLES